MAKDSVKREVDIVRFFETGPIDKVEAVFNIVREKMRERLRARNPDGGESPPRGMARNRSLKTDRAEDAAPGAASAGEA